MEPDIQKGLQKLYGYDTDNHGFDVVEDNNDLSWYEREALEKTA
jgi:hypothetical protein